VWTTTSSIRNNKCHTAYARLGSIYCTPWVWGNPKVHQGFRRTAATLHAGAAVPLFLISLCHSIVSPRSFQGKSISFPPCQSAKAAESDIQMVWIELSELSRTMTFRLWFRERQLILDVRLRARQGLGRASNRRSVTQIEELSFIFRYVPRIEPLQHICNFQKFCIEENGDNGGLL
jgi:hypothetical protein